MSRRSVFFARLRALMTRNRLDRELDEELRFHLEMQTEDNRRKGMSPEKAREAAVHRLGGLESVKEEYRERLTFTQIETAVLDVRYAFRTLCRSRGFAIVAVLSLALGIGGNTAIFSLLDTVLLRTLPVKDPEQLVLLSKFVGRSEVRYFSEPAFERLRAHQELFVDALASFDAEGTLQASADIPSSGRPVEMVHAQLVSGNYYSVLGVSAFLGRTLTLADDHAPDAGPVAVLSYGYWRERFAGDSSAIGKRILLNGSPFSIVGVTGPEFFGIAAGTPPDVTVPFVMQSEIWLEPGGSIVKAPGFGWLRLMVRLRPEIPEEKARAGLTVLFQQIDTDLAGQTAPTAPGSMQKQRIEFAPESKGLDALRARFSKPLQILTSLVGLVLLVACSNLAALLLARAATREREIGIRMALGASRSRLIRQLLTESMLFSAAGGLLGLLVAYAATKYLMEILNQSPDPISLHFILDARLLAFTGGLTIVSALLFGLIPALQTSSPEISRTPARWGPVFGHFRVGRTKRSYAKILVAVQIALSLVLLDGAGLFIRSLQNLETLDPGFRPSNLLLVTVNPSLVGYREPQLSNAYEQMLARLAAIPGVGAATLERRPSACRSAY